MSALPALALSGPTASGKTAAALALVRALAERGVPVEIVSVDSALVYRGMDIGTAKPTAEERAQAPHHLIDIRDPAQSYSAADFARDARRLIAAIQARGALPLLVGGTLLYFKALMQGMAELPPANAAVRAELDARAARIGWPAMHAQLAQVDPPTAARLAPADGQRIQRALEVWQLAGRPLSELLATQSIACSDCPISENAIFSLEPADRAWLHQRIGLRFAAMLQQGLLDEVRGLRTRAELHAQLPSMRCVGYRQCWQALDGVFPLAELPERGAAATRQLARRQLTWLRAMPARQVIAADAPDASAQLVQAALGRLPA
ncbi:tRNA (adenosine(37)-N6)-dimethylallyltransferase MiaA [Comamonas flocculans]|uniref:tRNA dimethylallyltransferase n=1 Tax=Comamonas flocculans TaxID=2597701 RepID=A0A5B8RW49_9BURK|nr:tRNA (adenosine(37)-N6)-dimethylallyltransferase MiaA [Comamonas flocculans]QEA12017.1 tRNA (adenosine(37)-N6)-dimethylallyltransferase MiaA [Comamonas flocculans]